MYVRNFALHGENNLQKIANLVGDVVKAIGMNTEGMHASVYQYPAFGKGGTGYTYIQPITESFICVDAWAEHDIAYLFISSCREIEDIELIKTAISKYYKVGEVMQGQISGYA